LEKKYESEIDKALVSAQAFADISYDKVNIGTDSSITISDVRISPKGYNDTISLGSVFVKSSDVLMPIKGANTFKGGKFPDSLEVKLTHLAFDTRAFDQLNTESECRSLLGTLKYSNAGFSRMDADLRINVDLSNPSSSKIYIDMFDQASTTTIEAGLDVNSLGSTIALDEPFPLGDLQFTSELNEEAANSFTNYCSGLFKVSQETYIDKIVSSTKYSENTFGADLGRGIRNALAQYLRGGSRLVVQIRPEEDLTNPSQAASMKFNEIMQAMNLVVSLDGQKVQLEIPELTVAEEEAIAIAEQESAAAIPEKEFVVVPAARAREYIGSKIKIKRKGGKPSIKGRMTGFEKNRIAVEVYRHAGEMTLNVAVSDISKFEVFK